MSVVRKVRMRLLRKLHDWYPCYPYKVYNEDTRSIFIHIPKTAGSSLLNAVGAPPRGRLHIEYENYQRADPVRFEKYFKFAVVRSPIGRLVSCYSYLVEGGNQSTDDLRMREYIVERCDSFESFVNNVLSVNLIVSWPLLRPQAYYICNKHGENQMDLVLRFEHLDEDYVELRKHIPSLKEKLPLINQSSARTAFEISDEVQRKILDLYEIDTKSFYPHLLDIG